RSTTSTDRSRATALVNMAHKPTSAISAMPTASSISTLSSDITIKSWTTASAIPEWQPPHWQYFSLFWKSWRDFVPTYAVLTHVVCGLVKCPHELVIERSLWLEREID